MDALDETALAFDRAARKAGVEYAFMGAFAVMAWGEPRATTDVEVLVDYREDQARALADSLVAEGLSVSAADFLDALRDGGHASVFREDSVFWIDVKPARSPTEKRQVTEAAEVEARGRRLRVVRPEETIAFKLAFGTPKDEQDAMSILVRQRGRLDEARLASFAAGLGVAAKIAALRKILDDRERT